MRDIHDIHYDQETTDLIYQKYQINLKTHYKLFDKAREELLIKIGKQFTVIQKLISVKIKKFSPINHMVKSEE